MYDCFLRAHFFIDSPKGADAVELWWLPDSLSLSCALTDASPDAWPTLNAVCMPQCHLHALGCVQWVLSLGAPQWLYNYTQSTRDVVSGMPGLSSSP